jgi:hypothetical protein
MKNRWKLFMQSVVTSTSPQSSPPSDASPSTKKPARIVYVRDFETITVASTFWYSALRAALRTHRIQTPELSASESAESRVTNPATIILGVSPALYQSTDLSATIESREQSRQENLKSQCSSWESGTLLDCLPKFIPPQATLKDSGLTFYYRNDGYWRSCVVVPAILEPGRERAVREARFQQLNELKLRMAVGSAGGEIEHGPAPTGEGASYPFNDWDKRLIDLDNLKRIIEKAFNSKAGGKGRPKISWNDLCDSHKAIQDIDAERKAWVASVVPKKEQAEASAEPENESTPEIPVDELVEKVKSMDLDEHEKRLLGCIVNRGIL